MITLKLNAEELNKLGVSTVADLKALLFKSNEPVKTETKEEVKAEVKEEVKTEVVEEVKTEVKEEVKAEVATEVKIEEVKVEEVKQEVKPEVKVEVKEEVKPVDILVETLVEAKVAPIGLGKPEVKVDKWTEYNRIRESQGMIAASEYYRQYIYNK